MFAIAITPVRKNDLPGMEIMQARSIIITIEAARSIIWIRLMNISLNDIESMQTPV
jgi:hypothetical protein